MAKLRYSLNIKNFYGHITKEYVVSSSTHFSNLHTKIISNGSSVTGIYLDIEEKEITLYLPNENISFSKDKFLVDWINLDIKEVDTLPKKITLVNIKTGGFEIYIYKNHKNKLAFYNSESGKTKLHIKIF
nr:MAG TPA: hypothetical protein [Caudoviricetes sp.]